MHLAEMRSSMRRFCPQTLATISVAHCSASSPAPLAMVDEHEQEHVEVDLGVERRGAGLAAGGHALHLVGGGKEHEEALLGGAVPLGRVEGLEDAAQHHGVHLAPGGGHCTALHCTALHLVAGRARSTRSMKRVSLISTLLLLRRISLQCSRMPSTVSRFGSFSKGFSSSFASFISTSSTLSAMFSATTASKVSRWITHTITASVNTEIHRPRGNTKYRCQEETEIHLAVLATVASAGAAQSPAPPAWDPEDPILICICIIIDIMVCLWVWVKSLMSGYCTSSPASVARTRSPAGRRRSRCLQGYGPAAHAVFLHQGQHLEVPGHLPRPRRLPVHEDQVAAEQAGLHQVPGQAPGGQHDRTLRLLMQ